MTAPASSPSPDEKGFSLVEALVALFILAVATGGLIRATEAHIDVIGGLQSRAAAQWVAENRLVEIRLSGDTVGTGGRSVEMLGQIWSVEVTTRPTEDPDILAVDILVSELNGSRPLNRLRGFLDAGATVP